MKLKSIMATAVCAAGLASHGVTISFNNRQPRVLNEKVDVGCFESKARRDRRDVVQVYRAFTTKTKGTEHSKMKEVKRWTREWQRLLPA